MMKLTNLRFGWLLGIAVCGCGGRTTPVQRAGSEFSEDQLRGQILGFQDQVVAHLEAAGDYTPTGDTGTPGVDEWEIALPRSESIVLAGPTLPEAELSVVAASGQALATVRSGDANKALALEPGRYRVRIRNLGTETRYARVALVGGALEAGLATAPWPQFHANASLTGLGTGSGAAGRLKWSFRTGGAIVGSPIVGPDGTVYVASTDGQFYAIDSKGTKKWSVPLPKSNNNLAVAAAIGSDGTIYAGSGAGGVLALHPDGTRKWTFACGAVNGGITIGPDGAITFGSADQNVRALNRDGTLRWSYPTEGDVPGCPAVGSDGAVYVVSAGGNGYAINADGSERWTEVNNSPRFASPVLLANAQMIWVTGDSLYNENVFSGQFQNWFETGGYPIWTTPAIDRLGNIGFVAVGPNGYSGGGTAIDLYSLNGGSVQPNWTTVIGGNSQPSTSSPAVDTAGVFTVGTTSGNLVAVNPDGSTKWTFATQGPILSSPAIGHDGTIFVGSTDGFLYAIE